MTEEKALQKMIELLKSKNYREGDLIKPNEYGGWLCNELRATDKQKKGF